MTDGESLRLALMRQARHWVAASGRLGALGELAAPEAWSRLERYLGVSIRDHLRGVIARLDSQGAALIARIAAAQSPRDFVEAQRLLLAYRQRYFRGEVTVEFYTDAINSRTSPTLGAKLRACDTLAYRAMAAILDPLGHDVPIALTYIDQGRGASILKAGLRLWDGGSESVAAAIKLVRHNIDRPTSLIHEAGHQVAHITGWNAELATTIAAAIPDRSSSLLWSGWASEIAADAIAFVHTGLGAVLALHDVVVDEPGRVFAIVAGDPHPTGWLRVWLGIEMCRVAWGKGEWDTVAETWETLYPIASAPAPWRAATETAREHAAHVARAALVTPMRSFKGRRLVDLVDPARVSPPALAALERKLGPALYNSTHWIWTEAMRLLALNALRAGLPRDDRGARGDGASGTEWLTTLGGLPRAA